MRARRRLERELTLVLEHIRRIDGEATTSSERPDRSTGAAVFDEADHGFLTRERLLERADQLHSALDRVEDGTYGVCVECGQTIQSARLRALPEAETCVTCQQRREQRSVPRRRVA